MDQFQAQPGIQFRFGPVQIEFRTTLADDPAAPVDQAGQELITLTLGWAFMKPA